MTRLDGRTFLITRAAHQASRLVELLENEGATCIAIPAIEIIPTVETQSLEFLTSLDTYDWMLFTSANAVRLFLRHLLALGKLPKNDSLPAIAVIGDQTAQSLAEFGLEPSLIPARFVAEGLLAALPNDLMGKRILFPRARAARDILRRTLLARGAAVTLIEVYRTECATAHRDEFRHALRSHPIDGIIFTSAFTATCFFELAADSLPDRSLLIAIGPITATAITNAGLTTAITPSQHTIPAMVDAIAAYNWPEVI